MASSFSSTTGRAPGFAAAPYARLNPNGVDDNGTHHADQNHEMSELEYASVGTSGFEDGDGYLTREEDTLLDENQELVGQKDASVAPLHRTLKSRHITMIAIGGRLFHLLLETAYGVGQDSD
jgi:hypothetical protein